MADHTYLVIYQKHGNLRYTSLLNLQRIMDRLLRRSNIQLVYSNGFHPQPRMKFFNPLPLGYIGLNEVLQITPIVWFDPSQFIQELNRHTLPGLWFKNVIASGEPAYHNNFNPFAADYSVQSESVTLHDDECEIKIREFLKKQEFFKERRGKSYDLRKLVHSIKFNCSKIDICLSAKANATGRPDEVMEALGFDPLTLSYTRNHFLDAEMNPIP